METQPARRIFAGSTVTTYPKGTIILRPGEKPAHVYYLVKGLVRQIVRLCTGETFVIHLYKPGSILTLPWVINAIPARHTYEAVTPVELLSKPTEVVRKRFMTDPQLLVFYTKKLLTGVAGFLSRLEYLMLDEAYVRVLLLLVYFGRTYGVKDREGIRIPLPIPHREIAGWIGTTRETASIQVELLKKRGFIVYRGRTLIVPSLKKLEQEVLSARTIHLTGKIH